jgi:hypothetical protein
VPDTTGTPIMNAPKQFEKTALIDFRCSGLFLDGSAGEQSEIFAPGEVGR